MNVYVLFRGEYEPMFIGIFKTQEAAENYIEKCLEEDCPPDSYSADQIAKERSKYWIDADEVLE